MRALQNFDLLTWEIYLHTGFFLLGSADHPKRVNNTWQRPSLPIEPHVTAQRLPLVAPCFSSPWTPCETKHIHVTSCKQYIESFFPVNITSWQSIFSYLVLVIHTKQKNKTANSLTQWADQSVILPLCLANIKSIFINSMDRRSWIKCWKFRGGGAE